MDKRVMSLHDDSYMSLNDDWDRVDDDHHEENQEAETEANELLMSTADKKGTHKRRHSKCWKNFTIVGDKDAQNKYNIRCNFCKEHLYVDLNRSGTTTLHRHSRNCSKTPGSTPRIKKIDMRVFRDLIAVAIIEHDLPYSFVEYRRIREAFLYVNSCIEFWSRNTAVVDVLKIYEKEKSKLRQILSEIPGRICLTTDLWRAITVEGYLCLTAHYIDENWNLKAKIISFCAFPPPHSGLNLAMKLMNLLKAWGIEKKVFTITVDNASSNDNMQAHIKRQLRKDLVCGGEFFHIRCAAHILNLVVQDGLSVIMEALEKIRESVKFVIATESREKMFQGCVETVGIQSEAGLVLDVSTRWNSTYLMLSRAIQFKEGLRNLAEVEPSYKSFPSDLEWYRGELICEFLRPFEEMTKLISGSLYPTANLYFMQVWKIETWLRAHERSDDEVICQMVYTMREKFSKYWEDYSDILSIAAVLDPRLKFPLLRYCYDTLDPSTTKSKLDHVRKKMNKLYAVYKKNLEDKTSTSKAMEATLPAGYSDFYAFYSQNLGTGKSGLDKYLDEPVMDMLQSPNLDILKYWKDNAARFPDLSRMACDVLCIPITTVSSESSFSVGSKVLSKYRSRLLPSNVQALICARNWLRGFEDIGESEFFEVEEEEEEGEGEGEKEEEGEEGGRKKIRVT